MSRESRIRSLVKIVNESKGERGDPNRLNFTERRFLRKHPDWVREVFIGERSHIRANEIVRKMRAYRLGAEDIGAVWTFIRGQRR